MERAGERRRGAERKESELDGQRGVLDAVRRANNALAEQLTDTLREKQCAEQSVPSWLAIQFVGQ